MNNYTRYLIDEEGEEPLDYWLNYSSNPALKCKETAEPLNLLVGRLLGGIHDYDVIPNTLL